MYNVFRQHHTNCLQHQHMQSQICNLHGYIYTLIATYTSKATNASKHKHVHCSNYFITSLSVGVFTHSVSMLLQKEI